MIQSEEINISDLCHLYFAFNVSWIDDVIQSGKLKSATSFAYLSKLWIFQISHMYFRGVQSFFELLIWIRAKKSTLETIIDSLLGQLQFRKFRMHLDILRHAFKVFRIVDMIQSEEIDVRDDYRITIEPTAISKLKRNKNERWRTISTRSSASDEGREQDKIRR